MKKHFKILMLIGMSFFAKQILHAQFTDRSLEVILSPDSLFFCKSAKVPVKVIISGSINDTFRISYKLGNQAVVEELVPKTLNPMQYREEYTFKTLLSLPDSDMDTLRVKLSNDVNSNNNERIRILKYTPTATLPFSEDFEKPRFPPLNWSATPVGYYDAGWQRTNKTGRNGALTNAAVFYEGYEARYGIDPPERNYGYLMLPALDLTAQKNPFVVFDLAILYEPFLTFGAEISTDCGASFKPIYKKEGQFGYPINFLSDKNAWVRDSISLLLYKDSTVLIRFYAKHGNKDGQINTTYLDNINVYDAPIPTKDVSLSQIISPTFGSFCPSKLPIPIEVQIQNMGAAVLDTFIVSYQLNNTPSVSETVVRSLAFGESFKYSFLKIPEIPQNGVITLTTSVKVKDDTDGRNDALIFKDATSARLNLPYIEDFEGGYQVLTSFYYTGSNTSWFSEYDKLYVGRDGKPTKLAFSINRGQQHIAMNYPYLDLRNNKNPFLTFDVAYPKIDSIFIKQRNLDTLLVQVSTNCGRTFKTLYQKQGDKLSSSLRDATDLSTVWQPKSGTDWRRDTVFLNQFKDSIVLIRLLSYIGNYASIYIDNMKVEQGFDYDMGIVEKLYPTSELICASERYALPVRFTIRNNAFLAADSVSLSYQLDTEGVVSEMLNRRINPRDTIQFQFKQLMNVANPGKHNLTLIIKYLKDENSKNDTLTSSFNIANEYKHNTLEDFETAAFPPLDWQMRLTKAKGWDRLLTFGKDGQYSISAVSGVFESNLSSGSVQSLISAPINLRSVEKPSLIFDRFTYYLNPDFEKDTFMIDVSKDCGVTFQPTGYIRSGASLSTISQRREPSTATDWKTDTLDLSAFKGNTIQVRFNKIFQGGSKIYLDNVKFVDVLRKNLSLISLINPVDTSPLCLNSPFILAFNIRNDGTQAVDSFTIKYQIDNQTETTQRINFAIPPTTQKAYQMPILLSGLSAGQHQLRVIVNLADDTDNTLDTLYQTMTVQTSLKTPFYESFDALESFPPKGWLVQPSNLNSWKKATVINKYGTATPTAYFGNTNNKGLKDGLVLAPIDLKGAKKPRLLFDIACARFSNSSNDSLQIEISTNCGLNYTTIYLKSGTNLATAPNWASNSQWLPTAFLWRTDSIDLTAFTDSLILMRFVNISNNGQQLYLDNIQIADSLSIVKTRDINSSRVFSKIYPNPVSDNLIIEIDNTSIQTIKLELLNKQGQTVKYETKTSWDTPQYQWSMQGLPPGVYLLNIYNNQRVEQHKVVLMK